MKPIDTTELLSDIEGYWQDSILEQLAAYIRIPNKSPLFDPQWESHGYMERAVNLMADWCRGQPLPKARVEVRRLPGLTPLLLVYVPGEMPASGRGCPSSVTASSTDAAARMMVMPCSVRSQRFGP